MSLILKGIDLPKEGEKITLAIFHDGDIVSYKYLLPKEAEAIQIPKGHGDIKDVGKLEDELDSRCGRLSAEIVRNAPTILEAEE